MAAARYSSDVLQMFYGPIPRTERINLPEPLTYEVHALYDGFQISQNNFQEWLRVWRMDISERNPNNRDLLRFARENKEKITDLVEQETLKLNSVKVSFGLQVKFSIERHDEMQFMEHYFKEDETHVFKKNEEDLIRQKFDEFIEKAKGEIEHWSEMGSGWAVEMIQVAYVNVARYQPLLGGTYLPLPAKLANKNAIINVQNKDNECLKWTIRAALFPPKDGKNRQRPSKYPVNDGINYQGIDFPTPVKQIEKLEAQNPKLAINVFGWENDCVIVHRIGQKQADVPRINLMLIESGKIQHYCYVKRESALLFDQSKNRNAKHFCMMCLTGFSRADLLENHKKYCKGVNGRPTRTVMPEEGENILSFQNFKNQMKAPFIIYADFEALVRKILGCERERMQTSYTEKTERHEACGYSYLVVRSDGIVVSSNTNRVENAVGEFLSDVLQEEEKIRESLATPKPIVMTAEDWENFKNANDCHVCNKSLIKKDKFLDSMPIWDHDTGSYCGQSHKGRYYAALKEVKFVGPKRKRRN